MEHATENHGVPGSIPGLATSESHAKRGKPRRPLSLGWGPFTAIVLQPILGKHRAEVPKYPKPNILLVDLEAAAKNVLAAEGYNVSSGSFGLPYKVPAEVSAH